MQRRTLITTVCNRITAGLVVTGVFNLFELFYAVVSFYSNTSDGDVTTGLPDETFPNGRRRATADAYLLSYRWFDPPNRCSRLDLRIDRSAYAEATTHSRGYFSAFDAACSNSYARLLAGRLAAAGRFCGTEREPPSDDGFRRAVTFVRSFEYAIDPESKGVPEYHRTVEETLVDGCGDCKDLTYLLAGILSQPPFEYRTAMVFLPEHMLLGVHRDDLPSAYSDTRTLPGGEYVAVETTSAHSIGEFRDEPVLGVYDDGFLFFDRSAAAEAASDAVRNPSDVDLIAHLR